MAPISNKTAETNDRTAITTDAKVIDLERSGFVPPLPKSGIVAASVGKI